MKRNLFLALILLAGAGPVAGKPKARKFAPMRVETMYPADKMSVEVISAVAGIPEEVLLSAALSIPDIPSQEILTTTVSFACLDNLDGPDGVPSIPSIPDQAVIAPTVSVARTGTRMEKVSVASIAGLAPVPPPEADLLEIPQGSFRDGPAGQVYNDARKALRKGDRTGYEEKAGTYYRIVENSEARHEVFKQKAKPRTGRAK
jgi:hypothetical protein